MSDSSDSGNFWLTPQQRRWRAKAAKRKFEPIPPLSQPVVYESTAAEKKVKATRPLVADQPDLIQRKESSLNHDQLDPELAGLVGCKRAASNSDEYLNTADNNLRLSQSPNVKAGCSKNLDLDACIRDTTVDKKKRKKKKKIMSSTEVQTDTCKCLLASCCYSRTHDTEETRVIDRQDVGIQVDIPRAANIDCELSLSLELKTTDKSTIISWDKENPTPVTNRYKCQLLSNTLNITKIPD